MKRRAPPLLVLFLSIVALTLSACSFTSTSGSLSGTDGHDVRLIALLPVKVDGEISRERVALVHKLIRAQLEGKGFLLVEDQAVQRFCRDASCPNKGDLVAQYGVQALVVNEVSSVARANFLAGYVNSISGRLVFQDLTGKEIFSVSHTKRERGGLLFNTGQIAQAIIQTATNVKSDESFSVLAGLYAKNVVDEVPMPIEHSKSSVNTGEKLRVEIVSTQIIPDDDGAERICVKGTPGGFGNLVYRRVRTSLREVSPGQYCGLFRLSDFPERASLAVELATPYGGLAREPLSISNLDDCELTEAVKLFQEGKKVTLQVACNSKEYTKYLVYRASGVDAPFRKVGEIKGERWIENTASGARYAIVAVSKSGDLTSPVVLDSESSAARG